MVREVRALACVLASRTFRRRSSAFSLRKWLSSWATPTCVPWAWIHWATCLDASVTARWAVLMCDACLTCVMQQTALISSTVSFSAKRVCQRSGACDSSAQTRAQVWQTTCASLTMVMALTLRCVSAYFTARASACVLLDLVEPGCFLVGSGTT